MWGHLELPGDSLWEVVLRCGEGRPLALLKRLGKGFVYVTALRQPNLATLENLRPCLELQRRGCIVTRFQMPELGVGSGDVQIGLKCVANTATRLKGVLSITPSTGDSASADRPELFEQATAFNPGAEGVFPIQALMRHKSYLTTKKYINMARQLNGSVEQLHVPEFLRST